MSGPHSVYAIDLENRIVLHYFKINIIICIIITIISNIIIIIITLNFISNKVTYRPSS